MLDLEALPSISDEIYAFFYWITRLFWTHVVELECGLAAVIGVDVAARLPESYEQP